MTQAEALKQHLKLDEELPVSKQIVLLILELDTSAVLKVVTPQEGQTSLSRHLESTNIAI